MCVSTAYEKNGEGMVLVSSGSCSAARGLVHALWHGRLSKKTEIREDKMGGSGFGGVGGACWPWPS